MAHSFVAYIDESGDDGLGKYRKPGGRGGASNWLIISACLFRQSLDLEAVKWRDEMLAQMPDKKSRIIHFAELNHGQKLAACKILAKKPVRTISIIAYKPIIPDGIYVDKNQLYFYITRYLIERISWLCRDMRPQVPEGDGKVKITFSRRGGLSYDNFKEYMEKLKSFGEGDVEIHWPVIDIVGIEAKDHSKSASLQLADVSASSIAAGFEPDQYGNTEWRYAEIMRATVYHRKKNYFSYGLKFFPKHTELTLSKEQASAVRLFEKS